MVAYTPQQGDIVEVDFNPIKGREQRGKRPAVIINSNEYYRHTGLLIICPISNTENEFPMHLRLEEGMSTTGAVLTQHIRTIDPKSRPITFREATSETIIKKIINAVGLYIKMP